MSAPVACAFFEQLYSTVSSPFSGSPLSKRQVKNVLGKPYINGSCGLINLGNTCYGNSFMQPLLFSYPITFEYLSNKKKWIKNDYIKKYINFLELKFSSNEVMNGHILSSLLHPSGKKESLMSLNNHEYKIFCCGSI